MFDKEFLAIYLSIEHFQHFIKGHQFLVYTDHKPLTYTLLTSSDKYTPRQIRHLDFISQFTSVYAMSRVLKKVWGMHYLAYMQTRYICM